MVSEMFVFFDFSSNSGPEVQNSVSHWKITERESGSWSWLSFNSDVIRFGR